MQEGEEQIQPWEEYLAAAMHTAAMKMASWQLFLV